jgi:hypothetical protein
MDNAYDMMGMRWDAILNVFHLCSSVSVVFSVAH